MREKLKLLAWLEVGEPGWRLTRFEGTLTPRGEPAFFHINTLALLISGHTEHA